MKKIITFLMLASISAQAQTWQPGNTNPPSMSGLVYGSPGTAISGFANYGAAIPQDTAVMLALRAMTDAHTKDQKIKPGFSDYFIDPNSKDDKFEIYDHEATTIGGATIDLSKYVLSNSYSAKMPADINNGAMTVEQAIYKETITGAGSTPWFTASAPQPGSGTTVQINTYSNLMVNNSNGAFQINTPGGNTFQLATSADSGRVGWTTIDSTSRLFLGARYVSIPGNLDVAGLLKANAGISIGDPRSATLSITSTSVSFISNYSGPAGTDNTRWHDGLVLAANGSDGIVVNSMETLSGSGGMIRFASNSQIVACFSANGAVIGDGVPASSGLLTLISSTKGFIPPRMYDAQIFAMDNPEEGTEVYSLTEHAPVFYNGSNWMQPSHFKILQRRGSDNNSSNL